jgi:Fe-S oxidoreductase
MGPEPATNGLEDVYEQTMVCTSCGYCKSVCPAFASTLWEHNTARSKVMLAYGLFKGEVKPDVSVVQSVFECTTCADCVRRCPSKVDVLKIMMATRQELAGEGLIPENIRLALDNMKRFDNPSGEDLERRVEFVPDAALPRIGKGADVLLFVGCVTSLQDMKATKSVFDIMENSGVEYTYLGSEEPCCGLLEYLAGYPSKEYGKRIKAALDKLQPRPKTVVTPCPGCYRSLHDNYPAEGVDLGVEVKHTTEYLHELLETGRLKVAKKLDGNVFYHDPCDLGRHSDIYEPPRQLLSYFVEVKEFEFNRDKARCCGGGGGLQSTNYDITAQMAKRRVMEAVELGADVIVSACPACKSTLSTAATELKKEIGRKVKVMDIVEVVAKNTEA